MDPQKLQNRTNQAIREREAEQIETERRLDETRIKEFNDILAALPSKLEEAADQGLSELRVFDFYAEKTLVRSKPRSCRKATTANDLIQYLLREGFTAKLVRGDWRHWADDYAWKVMASWKT